MEKKLRLCKRVNVLLIFTYGNILVLNVVTQSPYLHCQVYMGTYIVYVCVCVCSLFIKLCLKQYCLLYRVVCSKWNVVFQVTKKTVMEIVRRLMTHMDRAEGTMYRDELLQKIILICSQNNFQYITNFEW